MNGLEQMFGQGSIIGSQLGLQAFNQQQDLGAMQGAGELQKLFQAEQMNPLKLRQQSLDNQTAQAQLPGVQAQSELLGQNARVGRETIDDQIKAKKSGFNRQMSDDERKMADNLAQQLARSNDPALKKIGLQMIADSEPVVANKLTTGYASDRDERKIRLQGQVQHGLLDAQIKAGRFDRSSGSGNGLTGNLATDVEQILSKQKKASEKHNTLIDASNRAAGAGNLELAAQFMARAEALRPQALAELRAVAAPNKAALGELGIQATPDINIAPAQQTNAPKQQMFAKNPKTGERIMSTDGGKTWQKAP